MHDLRKVDFLDLCSKLKKDAPFTYNALAGIATRTKRPNSRQVDIRTAIAFGILISNKNRHMTAIQKLVSVLLYKALVRTEVIYEIHVFFISKCFISKSVLGKLKT